MALSSPKSLDPGTGGGASVQPVTPPAAASESVAAGGSLASVTFGAFTDPGSRIASYNATRKNVVGSATISGSGLGAYTISGAADGEVITIELDALDSGGDVLATAVYTGTIAPASDGPADVLRFADIADYDFTTTGGTGGSGGAGPHDLGGGITATVYVVGSGATTAQFSNGLLVGDGDTSNYYTIEFDLGSDTEWIPLWIMGQWILGETASAGSLRLWTGETSTSSANVADDLQLQSNSSTVMRFRFANSATTFNTIVDYTGLSLGASDQFEFMFRSHCNAWCTVEGRQGTGTMPEWDDSPMSGVAGDVRSAVPSWRRYLRIKVGAQDASLNLLVQKAG